MIPAAAQDVLDFWFGAAAADNDALAAAYARWFRTDAAFDSEIRERFGARIEAALGGGLDEWERDVRARLALVILLDQFPRNAFRRTARAFAGDARALALAKRTVASGDDALLAPIERFFLLMPYQHAEDLAVQDDGVRLFDALAHEPVPAPVVQLLRSGLDFAQRHRAIVARFGRFPYRNEVLRRDTTPAEREWLASSQERFGQ